MNLFDLFDLSDLLVLLDLVDLSDRVGHFRLLEPFGTHGSFGLMNLLGHINLFSFSTS